jgi:hypothetical protein
MPLNKGNFLASVTLKRTYVVGKTAAIHERAVGLICLSKISQGYPVYTDCLLPALYLVVSAHHKEWTPEPVWAIWRRENSSPYRDSNSDPSVVQSVASRYTDYATPARNQYFTQVFHNW